MGGTLQHQLGRAIPPVHANSGPPWIEQGIYVVRGTPGALLEDHREPLVGRRTSRQDGVEFGRRQRRRLLGNDVGTVPKRSDGLFGVAVGWRAQIHDINRVSGEQTLEEGVVRRDAMG